MWKLTLVCSVVAAATLAGCAGTSWFRAEEARPDATIFSPLDLPAPNRMRTGSGAPGPDYWQQQVDYVIEATLGAETNVITASETITYTNNSPDPLDYIWVHLEQNLFREDGLGSKMRTASRRAATFGEGYTIEHVREAGVDGAALDFTVYDTLGRIDLPTPVEPDGGQLVFELGWSFETSEKISMRHGMQKADEGMIYELAQWFPAVAVYDDVHGWNTLPYLGGGEFYTNFGNYDVRLTVPRSHLVVATGVLQNPADVYTTEQNERIALARESEETVMIRTPAEVTDAGSRPAGDGPLTWHFAAEQVRTFAWASSDAYIQDACGLDDVLLQSVYPKEKHDVWKDSTQMLRAAIAGYNERWHPYPYPVATNVYGREGGMEYPMIIFCRGRSERGLYGVTTHEIGHTWFPMMVNTDERRHAWMDEGFNSFINYYSTADWFEGETGRRGNAARFADGMTRAERRSIDNYPDHLPRRMVGQLAYAKTAVGLVLLREQILGPERFDFAFRTYIERWAFKSPRPADFYRTMEDAAGADLAWFWRGWFLETGTLDQLVRSVGQEEQDDGTRVITVTLDNLHELVMPVTMKVTYRDGTTETRTLPVEIWLASNRHRTRWTAHDRVVKVVVDPKEKLPDVKRSNNVWRWD